MAALRISESQIAVISKNNITVYNLGGTESHVYSSEKPKITDAERKHKPQGNEEGSERVLASGFSPSGRLFVSCDDYKQLTLWGAHSNAKWDLISTRAVARRVTSLTFSRDESTVLVGDKSGDVFRFSLSCPEEKGELLMGHVSMLLDLTLCSGDRLLATCDRDEKIRISHNPNAYSIHSFCLGHTDFVSRLVYVEQEDILISGSGDGTVRIWNYMSGEEICQTDCQERLKPQNDSQSDSSTPANGTGKENTDSQDGTTKQMSRETDGLSLKCLVCCKENKLIAVGFERLPVILIYKMLSESKTSLTFVQEVNLQGHLWDATFDAKGQLWILQASEETPLSVYQKISANDDKLEPIGATNDVDNILATVNSISKQWDILKDSVEGDNLFSILHKVKIDNATFYQERKVMKMEEQKQRYKEKADRRKIMRANKEVLPPGESEAQQGSDSDVEVAPSVEEPFPKKNKLEDT